MKAYLICYDLDKPGQNYEGLTDRLTEHGAIRIQLSVWAVQTTWTAVQLRDDLKAYIDQNDRLLVAAIGSWAYSNLMAADKFNQIAA